MIRIRNIQWIDLVNKCNIIMKLNWLSLACMSAKCKNKRGPNGPPMPPSDVILIYSVFIFSFASKTEDKIG